jgi:hypothetical protein
MKLRFTALTPLPLLLSLAAAAQTPTPAPPPIKMGLWQSSVTVKMSGMDNLPPSAAAASTHTMVYRSCMTADSWNKAMQSMQSAQQKMDCTTSRMQQDSHQLSFDESCTAQQGYTSSIHVQMLLDSDEAMHGTSNVKMTGPAFPQGMSMSSTITSKFISSDCGDIKPGEQKPANP